MRISSAEQHDTTIKNLNRQEMVESIFTFVTNFRQCCDECIDYFTGPQKIITPNPELVRGIRNQVVYFHVSLEEHAHNYVNVTVQNQLRNCVANLTTFGAILIGSRRSHSCNGSFVGAVGRNSAVKLFNGYPPDIFFLKSHINTPNIVEMRRLKRDTGPGTVRTITFTCIASTYVSSTF